LSGSTNSLGITDADIAAFSKSEAFDAQWYLEEYPDVAKSGIDPARHYLWIGRRMGRKPHRPTSADEAFSPAQVPTAQAVDDFEGTSDLRLIDKARRAFAKSADRKTDDVYDLVAQYLDQDFYLTNYPDIAAAGADPIRHYLDNGWRENRDPALSFSTRFYVENNPDVVAAGVNPFFHYLTAGKSEGRKAKHELGFRWDTLSRLAPVADQIAEMKAHRAPAKLANATVLVEALRKGTANARKIIVSYSHDDFTRHVGGVQLLLRRELKLLTARNDVQIHCYPVSPLQFLDTSGEDIALGVLIDGKHVGSFCASDVAIAMGNADLNSRDVCFIVHSLLGHNMDQTIRQLRATGATSGYLWIHDYSPIYNNYKLLRNDVEYNGYPKLGTLARELCEFARANFSHAQEFAKLFDEFKVELMSPSAAALDIWNASGILKPQASYVVNHIRLHETSRKTPTAAKRDRPLRVGFLGYPATHKGWPVFQELALKYAADPRYEFYHLGMGRKGGVPVTFREVSASETNMDAMRAAVDADEIDVALIWSIWPETFCLTAYEALAGGATLITNKNAGNVVDIVAESGQGTVLNNEAQLHDAFDAGDFLSFARSDRTVVSYVIEYSALSLEILD
jgi:hypothetical protein